MVQTYGDFVPIQPDPESEYLNLSFSPSSAPLMQRWRNNGLSADFLGDYVTTFFPGEDDDARAQQQQTEIRGAVSYIANELLENAMKYSDGDSGVPISISLFMRSDLLAFITSNGVGNKDAVAFHAFIANLQRGNAGELFIQRLEQSALCENDTGSGLGYLTMINDYGAQLAWQFSRSRSGAEIATTQVVLSI